MKDSLGLTWHSVFVTVWIREKKCNLTHTLEKVGKIAGSTAADDAKVVNSRKNNLV